MTPDGRTMTAVDFILEGLEAELALERELGVRSVEFDRSLLAAPAKAADARPSPPPGQAARPAAPNAVSLSQRGPVSGASPAPRATDKGKTSQHSPVAERQAAPGFAASRSAPRPAAPSANSNTQTLKHSNTSPLLDFVFLHDRPLSPKGVEMMAKIVTAMGKTSETAPVVIVPPPPRAKAYVVLGGLALRKHFPGLRGEPGQWLTTESGGSVLVTYSPEYILRFGTVTPAVLKMKKDMWTSLKAVVQRTR